MAQKAHQGGGHRDPPPGTRLMAFGDSGIELELRVWLQNPEAGLGSVRSDINLAIWRAFKAAGIVIPIPSDLHIRSGLEALTQSAPQPER